MKTIKLLPCVTLFTLLFISAFAYAQDQMSDYFVLKITTTAGTNATDKTFTFHTQDNNYMVDWGEEGDGFEPTTGNASHTFITAGEKTIRFKNLNDIYINYDLGSRKKYTSIEQWGTAVWNADMSNAFDGATNLTASESAGTPNMSAVTDMSGMFRNVIDFNQDIGGWDVSKVTDMSDMFLAARSFNQDIGRWNVSKVKNMSGMFFGASAFNQDIGRWNVSKVRNMRYMFFAARAFNQNIGGWNVFKVTDMFQMLDGARLSLTNYEALLVGWNGLSSLQWGVTFYARSNIYCSQAARDARANLINQYGWNITDDGAVVCPATTTTSAVENITTTTATLGGTVSNPGGVTITSTGIVYSSSNQDPEIAKAGVTNIPIGNTSNVFFTDVGSLTLGTPYYYRSYVIS